jgi:hypothetical protein
MPKETELTEYKRKILKEEQKEFPCGIFHDSIEEALIHAEINLGMRDPASNLIADLKPYLGTTRYSGGTIVGWQSSNRTRFRLDFDHNFRESNLEAIENGTAVNKGSRGVHVNEEDFNRTHKQKVCHPTRSSLQMAEFYWKRWSRKYGKRHGTIERSDLE